MGNTYDEELGRCAEQAAKSVFGERQTAQIEAVLADKQELRKLYETLSERDRKAVESVLKNPQLLKSLLSSPKAREGLQKLLGGRNDG